MGELDIHHNTVVFTDDRTTLPTNDIKVVPWKMGAWRFDGVMPCRWLIVVAAVAVVDAYGERRRRRRRRKT